jgi:hypothetical protein
MKTENKLDLDVITADIANLNNKVNKHDRRRERLETAVRALAKAESGAVVEANSDEEQVLLSLSVGVHLGNLTVPLEDNITAKRKMLEILVEQEKAKLIQLQELLANCVNEMEEYINSVAL